MAGHSRWANIRHRKGEQDVRRGRLFTKIIREITIAARQSGDPDSNPRLRVAMDKALDANMTKDTVERALKRGTGELEGARYEEIRYEGYGPGGAAVIVECQTDNRTRTVGDVRHAFSKHGGNLGQDGSVAYLFNKTGLLTFPPGTSEDKVMETALETGVEDVVTDGDGTIEVLAVPEQLPVVAAAMKAAGLKPVLSEVVQRPANFVSLTGADAEKMLELLEALEDLDDVQNVHTNADFQTPGG